MCYTFCEIAILLRSVLLSLLLPRLIVIRLLRIIGGCLSSIVIVELPATTTTTTTTTIISEYDGARCGPGCVNSMELTTAFALQRTPQTEVQTARLDLRRLTKV